MFLSKLQPKLQSCSRSAQEIHLGHLAGLDAVDDVDVGLHRPVVGVAGVGTDQRPFRVNLIKTDAALVDGDAYRLVHSGHPAELLELAVHRGCGLAAQSDVAVLDKFGLFILGSNLERNGVFYLHKKWDTVKSYPKNIPFLCHFKYFCMEMYTT